mgnify:CR=1 FL=1
MLIRLMVLTCLISSAAIADNKTVYLVSLEWPPYTGEMLNHQGASVAVARSMFEAMGYNLVVDFMPWSDAIKVGSDPKSKYMGFFPIYQSKTRDEQCHYSEPIGFSPLGFAQLKSLQLPLENMDDLSGVAPIGVVKDYFNSEEFDARAKLGEILTVEAETDLKNLIQLGQNELPLIVIDRHVMDYLLGAENALQPYRNNISFNKMLLEEKRLYICFKKTPDAIQTLQVFNRGVEKINMRDFFNESLR